MITHHTSSSPRARAGGRAFAMLRLALALGVLVLSLGVSQPSPALAGGSLLPPGDSMRVDSNVDPPLYDGEDIVDCGVSAGWQLPTQFGSPENVPKTLDGQVVQAHIASDDFPLNHGTKDFNFFVYPDQPYRYLLSTANFSVGADVEHGRIEVEWELESTQDIDPARRGGFPSWAWPTQGDRVHVVGSHIADCGHDPKRAEIHAPRLVVTYRNAAQDNFAGASNRQGSWFAFDANQAEPTLATRADVFASSYGGESVEEEYDNVNVNLSELYPYDEGPQGDPQTWWQPINDRDYTFEIKAPPKPFPGAVLTHAEVQHPVQGAVGPEPIFTELPLGDGYSVTLPFSQVSDPPSHLMVFSRSLYVGWKGNATEPLPSFAPVRRYRVDITNVHIQSDLDDAACGEIAISAYINDVGRRLIYGDTQDSLEESFKFRCDGQNIPSGGDPYNETLDSAIPGHAFDVSLVAGQPLRVHFRGFDREIFENDEMGTAEDIWITGVNDDDSAWANMDQTALASAGGGVMGAEDIHNDCVQLDPFGGCYQVTYHITRFGPPIATLGVLSPHFDAGPTTWVRSDTQLLSISDFGANAVGPLTQFHRFARIGTNVPAPTVCSAGICFFKIDQNDGADGHYLLQYWVKDEGNGAVSVLYNQDIGLDNTPPSLAITGAGDGSFSYTEAELTAGVFTNASSLNVSYSASDAGSGLYQVRVDGLTSVAGSGTFAVPLAAGISMHTLEAEDNVGNVSSLTFPVVSVALFPGGVAPQGGGFWKNAVKTGAYTSADLDGFLAMTNIVSQAFGPLLNRYPEATLANYQSYLTVTPNADADLKVRRDLLTAWLNFVSGREPAAQSIDVKKVQGWENVVTNTGGSSQTTALNLVREVERRLGESPSPALLNTIQLLLDKLSTGNLNK